MPLLLRRTSHLRQVRDGPRLPHREGPLRRGRARRFEVHPRRGVAKGDPPLTRPCVLFLDAQATEPKREALEAIATAKAGGPMNIYMSMMTEPPEVRTARIEFRFIGKRSRFRIGDRVRVEFEPMRNPVTGEDHFLIGQLPT